MRLAQARGSLFTRPFAGDDERRNLRRRRGKPRLRRQAKIAVEDDAQRRALFESRKPHVQQGIIRQNGANAHHDGVVHGAHDMDKPVRRSSRDHETRTGRHPAA